ncbi:MAG: relaxase domain-containing protein, partial [Bifidobacteriaceae bacterium]|nr:relaxase domain-containing protein [Bifidobacteriaceae bacterium]
TAASIETTGASGRKRRPVAGYDYTFSVPKSVSVLWGLADAGSQELLVKAHHDAMADVLAFMEREVAVTRVGRNGAAQAEVTGVLTTAYDHWDSRAGDPQLHTHVVVSNKVCTAKDSKWRTLDGRPMRAATVAMSELYNGVLADHLTRLFGLGWDTRDRGRNRNPAWEVEGVTEELIAEFSQRTAAIEAEKDRLVEEYARRHGRQPSARTVVRLRQQATLATRQDKEVHSLAALTADWRRRAQSLLGADATDWARGVLRGLDQLVLRADDVPLDVIERMGRDVVAAVSEKRPVWRRWNLHAEASRQTMGWRFATSADRESVVSAVAAAAENLSLRLSPLEMAAAPEFQRADGTSALRPRHMALFSSEKVYAAEARLLALSRDVRGPAVPLDVIEHAVERPDDAGRLLSPDQAQALTSVAVSGRRVDLLVGPAGAGKTTALAVVRRAWEHSHEQGSVVGLAPSATAAAVLGEDLGIATENTAKWLSNHDVRGDEFTAGQLVIIDEASLAGTLTLDRITSLAAQAGAKVLLVGDWAQLQAVDAGGAFNLLVADRADAPELRDIHRFRAEWEKPASLELRHGHPAAIDAYLEHGRVNEGDQEAATEQAYQAWAADLAAGRASLLIADSHATVRTLNERARDDRIEAGLVDALRDVTLADGSRCSKGDLVITRRNDRRLSAGSTGWVRNGDRWQVAHVHGDGAVTVRQAGHGRGAAVILPADYVAEHLDLGYAVTAHRSQGVTVDTAHCVVTPTTTRENLYVAMTRGRSGNHAYVATDRPDESHTMPHPSDDVEATAATVLAGVLANSGAELSAHQTEVAEHEWWNSIRQLAAERETVESVALADHWAGLIRSSGLTEQQVGDVMESEAFGPLCAELRRADANHRPVGAMLSAVARAGELSTAQDVASVLRYRMSVLNDQQNNGSVRSRQAPRMILGFIPEAEGACSPQMKAMLDEYKTALNTRARELARRALTAHDLWLSELGTRPTDGPARTRWDRALIAAAAYRELHNVTGPSMLGTAATARQREDATRVRVLVNQVHPPGTRTSDPASTPVPSRSQGPSM